MLDLDQLKGCLCLLILFLDWLHLLLSSSFFLVSYSDEILTRRYTAWPKRSIMANWRSCPLFMVFRFDVCVKECFRIACKQLFMRTAYSEMFLIALFLAFVLLRFYLLLRTLRILELLNPLKINLWLRANENVGVLGNNFTIASSIFFSTLLWVCLAHILIRRLGECLIESSWLVNIFSLPLFPFLQIQDALRLSRILIGWSVKRWRGVWEIAFLECAGSIDSRVDVARLCGDLSVRFVVF